MKALDCAFIEQRVWMLRPTSGECPKGLLAFVDLVQERFKKICIFRRILRNQVEIIFKVGTIV